MTGDTLARELARPRTIDWRVKKTREFMRAHLRERLTLGQFASAAGGIGRGRLLQLFKPTGESPCQAFKRMKMEEAARLLREYSDISVKEVALELGYRPASLAKFSRDFSAFCGAPPSRYREECTGRNLFAMTATSRDSGQISRDFVFR